jgi:DNA repair protein RadC
MKVFKSPLPELTLKYKTGELRNVKLKTAEQVHQFLLQLFNDDTIEYSEEFIVVFLNIAMNTIGWMRVSTGGMTNTLCDSRMVFVAALKCGATGIILSHNHPSGRVQPSSEDILMTRTIVASGKILGIKVHDHIIVTPENYHSMCNEGTVQF